MTKTERDKLFTRWGALKAERSSFVTHWREISEYLLPRTGRFLASDRNKGDKRHNNIYDSTGTRALRTLGAGMMAGSTSPARPWFRLATADPEMMASEPVKVWLHDVQRLMLDVFARSNTYRALHSMYEELGAYGTSASIIVDDFDSVIHNHTLTAGEYAIASDYRGKVQTLYREFDLTVAQMVGEFGRDKVSPAVRTLFDRGNLDAWVQVIHAIEPRSDRDATKRDAQNMAWKSVYFEQGCEAGRYLSESGFEHFPALVPRWAASGGDIYGNSPGMEALGDIRQLQHEQLRKAQGIDYMTKPPLQVPTSMKNRDLDTLPGGVSFVDTASPTGGIRSAFEVNLRLDYLLEDIRDVRERVRSTFYADLFLMLAGSDRPNMTATEVAERHEEKLLMLGPVLEALNVEFLNPGIDRILQIMRRAGQWPEFPPDLDGVPLRVEYTSILAQAQKAVKTIAIEQGINFAATTAQFLPAVLDRIDSDGLMDEYFDGIGFPPKAILSIREAEQARQARADQQQAQQQLDATSQVAAAARDGAAATEAIQPNVLQQLLAAP